MPGLRADSPTLAGGEISPLLAGRFDTAKYHTAARKLRNMLAQVGGGAYARPGTGFVAEAQNNDLPVRQVPFQFSMTQGYMLQFGERTMRIAYKGSLVLDNELIITGITNALQATVTCPKHAWSVGDDVYFTGVTGMTEINGLIGRVVVWIDADNVKVNINTAAFGVFTGSTGGVAGDALGGTGGNAPPEDPTAAPTPVPPFVPEITDPPVFGGYYGGLAIP